MDSEIAKLRTKLITKTVKWADPKLAKYRSVKPFVPHSSKELMAILRRTPKDILSDRERDIIIAAANFRITRVDEIMIPRSEMTFVHENEILGPLMLDKLYKSGFSHFPVVDSRKKVIGALHTEALMSLAVKETDRAKKFLDTKIYYVRRDYTLEQTLAAFTRTNAYFLLVIDSDGEIVGIVTYQLLAEHLLGKPDKVDTFDRDDDIYSVAQRNKKDS